MGCRPPAAHLPVARVHAWGSEGAEEWLVTQGMPGVDATRHPLRAEPARLVSLLAAGLRRFHAVPARDCPYRSPIAAAVDTARLRVRDGLIDPSRDLHPDHGARTPTEALDLLEALRPEEEEDLAVCHGDYCLPNVLLDTTGVRGYVDLGRLAVADRWWDLAIATWSCTWNLGPGCEDAFWEAYGVRRDARKIAFYRLLYDLLG